MTQRLYFETERLLIEPLASDDANFILELVNTKEWIKFIGDRNINFESDAIAYIQKILGNKDITYWVVKLKSNGDKMGIITFIKRAYLDHHDIGFAFLPKFFKNGYAYEATIKVLQYVSLEYNLSTILATTVAENISSIRLLEKIGLRFLNDLNVDNKSIQVYGMSTDKLLS